MVLALDLGGQDALTESEVTLSLKYSANIQNGNDREQFSRNIKSE
jgi:hypothetical protein